jgi:uncharacterized membrane protein (DUF106 family)
VGRGSKKSTRSKIEKAKKYQELSSLPPERFNEEIDKLSEEEENELMEFLEKERAEIQSQYQKEFDKRFFTQIIICR